MKSNTQLRQKSIKKVLNEIRIRGPLAKRELQEITGFSWGNISSITTELFNDNYITASGKIETYVGRRPEAFDINENDTQIVVSSKGKTAGFSNLPFGYSTIERETVVNEQTLWNHDVAELAVINAQKTAKAKKLTVAISENEYKTEDDFTAAEEEPIEDTPYLNKDDGAEYSLTDEQIEQQRLEEEEKH